MLQDSYGMSEYISCVSAGRGDLHNKQTTCGKPFVNTEAKVTDENGCCVPCGTVGELCIRGYGSFLEYKNQPELTALMKTSDGWLKTGYFLGLMFGCITAVMLKVGGHELCNIGLRMHVLEEVIGVK